MLLLSCVYIQVHSFASFQGLGRLQLKQSSALILSLLIQYWGMPLQYKGMIPVFNWLDIGTFLGAVGFSALVKKEYFFFLSACKVMFSNIG